MFTLIAMFDDDHNEICELGKRFAIYQPHHPQVQSQKSKFPNALAWIVGDMVSIPILTNCYYEILNNEGNLVKSIQYHPIQKTEETPQNGEQ